MKVLKDGVVGENYFRVVTDCEFDAKPACHVQMKIRIPKRGIQLQRLMMPKYEEIFVTIKVFQGEDIEFNRNEAIELFNNIVNPYQYEME